MTDKQLSDLFGEGTAPETDPVFALSVAAEIGRERLRTRLLALAVRTTGVVVVAGAAFVAAGVVKPVLAPLVDESPQFMGAPVPAVLCVLIAGLALLVRRRVLSAGGSAEIGLDVSMPPDR